jgi:ParB family transcriptional regulator, chromosome partitioning protein
VTRSSPTPTARATPPTKSKHWPSIRENGLLRPILVSQTDDGFVIVHGERRWRAARALGHATIVACLVMDFLHRSPGL